MGRAVLPGVLIALGVLSAAAVAGGMRAELAHYERGLEVIVAVRRVQWLLVGASLVSCMSLLTVVIAGKRDVWWLLGLMPVLALFTVRFGTGGDGGPIRVLDFPQFCDAAHPTAPQPDEWVVGVTFEGQSYAFPYRALHGTPIVAVTDYSKRMLLIFSPRANRAVAFEITRELRPRALEVVSTPAGGLLIYDRRYGQFISSVTGRTLDGEEPIGFADRLITTKTTWSGWRATHPETFAMVPVREAPDRAPSIPLAPGSALPERCTSDAQAELPVALVEVEPPVAVPSQLPLREPLNAVCGETRLLLFRDPRSGAIRGFERRASDDLFPTFVWHDATRLVDSDTQSIWTSDGRAVEGPMAGEQLRPIPVEEGLYWGIVKYWYPRLQLAR